jgi:hypothetical protein
MDLLNDDVSEVRLRSRLLEIRSVPLMIPESSPVVREALESGALAAALFVRDRELLRHWLRDEQKTVPE